MSRKGFLFAAAAVCFASSAFTPASAGSIPALFALERDTAAVVNVGYHDHGYYDRQYGPYYGNGLLDIPATLIGGALGIVTGALDGAFYGGPFFAGPIYDNGYYGYRDHSDQYYNNAYYGTQHYGNQYYGNGHYGNGHYGNEYYDNKYYNNGYYADAPYKGGYYPDGYYSSGYYNSGYYGDDDGDR
jgi:hypothetical protein